MSALQRRLDEKKVGWLYATMDCDLGTCTYCGGIAQCMDHVPPLSHAARMLDISRDELMSTTLMVVPSCYECNGLAGSSYQATLSERRAYVKRRLREKYRQLLLVPKWSEDEIAELGYHLATVVKTADYKFESVRERLAFNPNRGTRPRRIHIVMPANLSITPQALAKRRWVTEQKAIDAYVAAKLAKSLPDYRAIIARMIAGGKVPDVRNQRSLIAFASYASQALKAVLHPGKYDWVKSNTVLPRTNSLNWHKKRDREYEELMRDRRSEKP